MLFMFPLLCLSALLFNGGDNLVSAAKRGPSHSAKKDDSNNNTRNSQDAKILTFPIVPHEEILRRNRSRNLSSEANAEGDDNESDTLEVGGLYQGYGTHYVDLWVGTPPQRQTVIVDTGSGVTAFPCSKCADCGSKYHADAFFQEDTSETFTKFNCQECGVGARCSSRSGDSGAYCHLSVSYQEGSMWTAYQGQDITYVGGLHDQSLLKNSQTNNNEQGGELHGRIHGEDPNNAADYSFDMVFGCQTKITGLFKTQLADGIMGMCLKPSSIFEQMYRQNIIATPSFSLCFTRAEDAAKEGSIAGALTMGGTDERLHSAPMVYAFGFPTKGVMHGVSIRKIYVMESGQYEASEATLENTQVVDIQTSFLNSGSVIVDSGTTDTYMTRSLKVPFMKAFKKVTGFDYIETGMKLTDLQVSNLPTIIIQLQGHDEDNKNVIAQYGTNNKNDNLPGLAGVIDEDHPFDILIMIPPAHYVEFDTDHQRYVGRFSMTEGGGSVLGANAIRGHDVYFDIPERSRIGFAPSECDYYHLISEEEGDDIEEEVETNKMAIGNDDYYENDETYNDSEEEQGGGGGGDTSKVTEDDEMLEPIDTDEKKKDGIGSNTPFDIGSSSVPKEYVIVGSIVALATFFIVKRKRQARDYTRAALVGDHINDLHLDTEIENLPALA